MDPAPTNILPLFASFGPKEIGFVAAMIVLLVFSGFFSSTETAFTSFNKIRMKNLAQGGSKRATLVTKIESKYDRFLTSVLVGNNIVNISLSSIATIFFIGLFKDANFSDPDSIGSTVSTVVITVAVLIFGEISPKVIARQNADKMAMLLAPFINAIIIILMPLSLVFGGWSKLLSKIFRSKEQSAYTEEELITIVDEAEEDGTLESEEGDLIRSAIEFNDVCAGDILTPRVDICAISKDETVPNIAKIFIENAYSRLPVYDEDLDDIIGILHEKDFFIAYHNNNKTITKHLKKPVHVSEHIKIADLLQVLKSKKCHMAVVVDEFGGTMGIVTMEDIIEELIGDVFDEHDEISEDYKELPDGSYIVKGSAELDNFLEKFETVVEDDEDMPQTVNGLIMKELGSFPHVGDSFDYQNLKIEIKKIGTKRIEEIKVTKIENEEKGAE
ncbi:MAG: HlyC/CorC family transporter [Clostridia bacterium]|nr:HlyC/CorC family transporter [Clostridia bacterium]